MRRRAGESVGNGGKRDGAKGSGARATPRSKARGASGPKLRKHAGTKPVERVPSRAADAPRHPEKLLSGAEAKRELARVRKLCLALPRATEKVAWGAPTWRVGKIFAMFDDHHHGAEHVALWVPAPKGAQQVLVASEPERFFKPPYVGPSGWVGIVLARIDDERLAELVRDGYRCVAPKGALAELDRSSVVESSSSARRPGMRRRSLDSSKESGPAAATTRKRRPSSRTSTIYRVGEVDEELGTWARFGHLGTWESRVTYSHSGECAECGKCLERLCPPLVIEALDGSRSKLADVSFFSHVCVVTNAARERLLRVGLTPADFAAVKVEPSAWFRRRGKVDPFAGHELHWLRPVASAHLDCAASGLPTQGVCSLCGQTRVEYRPGGLVIQPRLGAASHAWFHIHEHSRSIVYVSEPVARRLAELKLQNLALIPCGSVREA